MSPKKPIDSSYCPNPLILESLSVKIECLDNEGHVANNGTGTLFSCGNTYYVITAAHCIQYNKTSEHYDKINIRITLPRISNGIIEVKEILDFNLNDNTDFALLSVQFDIDRFPTNFDYENDICFVSNDEFAGNTCIYGYTHSYPSGRKFCTEMVASDTYAIKDGITASGVEFANVMKGSSGGGIFVGYENRILCLGYVKSRMTETDRLDDIKIRRIPSAINDKFPHPILLDSIQQKQALESSLIHRSRIEIKYINKWNELYTALSMNEDIARILNDISELKIHYPYVKSVIYQEQITNTILRSKNQWNACQQRAFIYALQDRGLWPTLFGELPQAGDFSDIPEYKNMMSRASTFSCGFTDDANIPDKDTDERIYELVLCKAFKFEFNRMFEVLNAWNPNGMWAVKKALLVHLFRKDKDTLNSVRLFIENKTNSDNERFVATLIYNIASQQFPQPYEYTEFLESGVEEPSEIISYIAARIDKKKTQPQIFGSHSTQIFGSTDSTSFPESIRLLQYLANTGLTTKFGIYSIVNIEYWMKVFRHLVHFIPYPTVYYTLQYAEEKTVRWAGQMIAYSDDDFLTSVRPDLLNALLRALRMKCTPRNLYASIYYITQELYVSVDESIWYDEFRKSVLDYFVAKIDVANVSMSDAIYKNLFSAIQCIKNIERRKEIFIKLAKKMSQAPHLISRLLCNALIVDEELAATPEVGECLSDIINQLPIAQSYHILSEFNRVNTLTPKQREIIDEKILTEKLSFSRSDYMALVTLSYLAFSMNSISKIRHLVLSDDIWNCGITDSCYTAPMPSHIELFDKKVTWSKEEWQHIRLNMEQNIELIESKRIKGESADYFNCMYLNLLLDMKLFILHIQQSHGFPVEDILIRVDANIGQISEFENLIEALSSDNFNEVNVALDLLNIQLGIDDFNKHLSEINLIINKVVLKQSANIDNCINFIASLMRQYPEEMKIHFGDVLLCLLKNYVGYDFESMNFRVPSVNHKLTLIAQYMKPEFEDYSQIKYWTSDEVINRFNGFATLH
jgi:hypothetical protein